jgi:hypothetical protein
MRKTFQLHIEGKNRDRILDAIKHDIRKYLQRERRRPVPEGAQFWDFDCRFGLTQDSAEVVLESQIKARIDAAAADGAENFYLEILAKPGVRAPRPVQPTEADPPATPPAAQDGA